MDFIKNIVGFIMLLGSTFSIMFAIWYVVLLSNTKNGKEIRHELFQIVEMGRRNE